MPIDRGLLAYWDYHNSIAYAVEIAEEKGKIKGQRQKAIEIAIELKHKGFSVDMIAKVTKLPKKEIENVK